MGQYAYLGAESRLFCGLSHIPRGTGTGGTAEWRVCEAGLIGVGIIGLKGYPFGGPCRRQVA